MANHQENDETTDANTALARGWHSLPAELRLMIYRLSWEPRAVCVERVAALNQECNRTWDRHVFKMRVGSSSRSPTTLHLCFESRTETLRHYVPFFRGVDEEGKPQVLYFNPSVDVLFLSFFPHFRFDDTLHPLMNPGTAKFWDLVSLARTVYFTGRTFEFKDLLEAVRLLTAEAPGRWLPAGESAFLHWEYLEWIFASWDAVDMAWSEFRRRCSVRSAILADKRRRELEPEKSMQAARSRLEMGLAWLPTLNLPGTLPTS